MQDIEFHRAKSRQARSKFFKTLQPRADPGFCKGGRFIINSIRIIK